MRAQAESSIVVAPASPWRTLARAVLDWCHERPRTVAAGALVALTLLSAVVGPTAQAPRAAAESSAADGGRAEDPAGVVGQLGEAAALYPLVALPRPAAGPIPTGKGMWLHRLNRAAGGDVQAIVDQAVGAGLTHLYVRLGSSKSGFYAMQDLDRLLPVAHRAGLRVVGWDFAYLSDPAADAARAKSMIWYATPSGDRIDAFSADIETAAEGTRLTAAAVRQYGDALRDAAGDDYPLVATVPRPSPKRWFPYAELGRFDAIAPMVYWGNREPGADVRGAIADLAFLGKPVIPVGQAYDMAIDGGPAGAPSGQAIQRFIDSADQHGALGVSFWVWDTATAEHWSTIAGTRRFDFAGDPAYAARVKAALGAKAPA